MQAIGINEHGGLEKVQVLELEPPVPGDGEVVVDIKAASLNHLEIWVREGRVGPGVTYPHVLGSDAAGVVTGVGKGVTAIQPGAEVVINPSLYPKSGPFFWRGEPNVDPDFGLIGFHRSGVFAEKVAVPAYCAWTKPSHFTFAQAAALPIAYVTAYRMLFTRAQLIPGERVLIHGIGGGVAIAALQLAKLVQAEVFVTSSSGEKLARATELGADHGLNYAECDDLGDQIRNLTGGEGIDVAIDAVGAATWPLNFEALRRGGRAVHCGVTTGAKVEADISALYWNHYTIMGSTMGAPEDFRRLLRLLERSGTEPVIDRTWPLEHACDAMATMENGTQFGKLVLEV